MRSIYETRQEQLALPKHNLLILANSRVEINTPNFLKQKKHNYIVNFKY